MTLKDVKGETENVKGKKNVTVYSSEVTDNNSPNWLVAVPDRRRILYINRCQGQRLPN